MNTRKDVEAEGYEINADGIITSPGKFEGEDWRVPILYDRYLNGMAEEAGSDVDGDDVVALEPDPVLFPDAPKERPALVFSPDGFVIGGLLRDMEMADEDEEEWDE